MAAATSEQLASAVLDLAEVHDGSCEARSEVTLDRVRSTYRSFFHWAHNTGRALQNPAAELRLAKSESRPTPPITPAEVTRRLGAIRTSEDPPAPRHEALFATYAYRGLCRSEVLALIVDDYDADSRLLRVFPVKGKRARQMPVPSALAEVLGRYIQRRKRADGGDCDRHLFPGRRGRALGARQAQIRFEHWKKAAGLPSDLTLHSFRAGFGTAVYRASRDLVLAATALGHRDLRLTLRYVEGEAARFRETVESCWRFEL